jgi:hypothetical protein
MADQGYGPLFSGGRLAANPHLYDYVHTLVFDPSGTVEMVDGAGQRLNTLVRGRFTVEELGPTVFTLHFIDLVEIDPYYKQKRFSGLDLPAYFRAVQQYVPYDEHDVRRRLDPRSICVTREVDPFLLRCQVIWKISDDLEWPYLLYRARYRFDSDPLAAHVGNREGSLYYSLDPPEPDTRVYYRAEDAQKFTARELRQAGISVEEDRL